MPIPPLEAWCACTVAAALALVPYRGSPTTPSARAARGQFSLFDRKRDLILSLWSLRYRRRLAHYHTSLGAPAGTPAVYTCPTGAGQDGFDAVTLPHPASDFPAMWLVDTTTNRLYELQSTYSDEPRSFLMGNAVQKDGRLFTITPFDPGFLILPFVRAAAILSSDTYPDLNRLVALADLDQVMGTLADAKDVYGEAFWRYNQEKTLKWLERKALHLYDQFDSITLFAPESKFCASNPSVDAKQYKLESIVTLLGDHVSHDLILLLRAQLGVDTSKSAVPEVDSYAYEMATMGRSQSANPYGDEAVVVPVVKKTRLPPTRAQSKLASANTQGMSLRSFFKPKPK
ncbi:hypothetical protein CAUPRSCDRAFT_10756 [Caulochytrium protostelioides]|uniref:Rnh202 triple barrel domain-containing protein n=1 Tax=Caulochytrium protostelioides TaxID=1555241 RepID=A0A4P9X1B1_9FUNG|nr:hypothetical protein CAUPRSCDRAFT_10756 [Caulochytrium protostelioides]